MPAALDFLVACIALSVYSFSASVCVCDVRVCVWVFAREYIS